MPHDANHRPFRRFNSTMTEIGRDILQTLASSEEALNFVVCPSQLGGTPCYFAQPMQTSLFNKRSWFAMDGPDTSSTFTCSSLCTSWDPDEFDEPNMWNPMLGHFCHVQVGVFMESYFDGVVLEEHSPVTLQSIYYVTTLKFIIVQC